MEVKKLMLLILVFGLTWTNLNSQKIDNLIVEASLSVAEDISGNYISPKFIFPNLKPNQLAQLSEIYIEFGLTSEISTGTSWPDFHLAAYCLDQSDLAYIIGQLNNQGSESLATHFLRIPNPGIYLVYDPVLNFYFFDLIKGFCNEKPGEMIGYVDIILNASVQTEGGTQPDTENYCTNITIELSEVSFVMPSGIQEAAIYLISDHLEYGPDCGEAVNGLGQRTNDETAPSAAIEESTEKILVYPNPASTHINISGLSLLHHTTLRLYTSEGQLVKKENLRASNIEWSLSDLPAALYSLQITDEDRTVTHKLLINYK